METFGMRLSRVRRENNLTQEDIAEKLHITAQAVSKWENDITSPDIDTLVKLSELLHISLDDLLGKKGGQTQYVAEHDRKDINQMVFKIIIDSAEGDRVRINLPVSIIQLFTDGENNNGENNNGENNSLISGNKVLESIDFKQLILLVEQGIMGELVSIDSADGAHVTITVE
ncbi:MAG: helix-turn-helix domain-containing protein [Anaeroplasma bactoclasticum]|nr:helix-turn-helix domain-containing protein [Anaeroplasma bactoclasticum]